MIVVRGDVFTFAVLALAVFRLTRILIVDDGPFDVFLKIRAWAGVSRDNGVTVTTKAWMWAGLLSCHWCLSVWVAFPAALLWQGISPGALAAWLALAGASSIIEEIVRRLRGE